jgi:hypothetical protein
MTETSGKTLVTTTVQYESKDARDAVMKSPMEGGLRAGFDRLAALVETVPS